MWFDKIINSTGMVDLQAQPGTTLPMMTIAESISWSTRAAR
jgi:hypothetical protein